MNRSLLMRNASFSLQRMLPLLRVRNIRCHNFSTGCCGLHGKESLSSTQEQVVPRQRRDDIWIPTTKLKKQSEPVDATELLIRAGYLRQAYAGIYHVLPLGLRVLEKLEHLIDKHMRSIGASKVSLSSISSQALWQRSGRLQGGSEFFKFADRKDAKWLLAPTHEEEITTLVKDAVHSPGQLPVRLYQISRKYRDEKRPRGGLLRGKEFVMKDLYTFDLTQSEAHETYDQVRQAYRNLFDELTVPYVEARADSGNMGGNLSHEYHFPSTAGEDDVICCNSCSYARNEEWVPDCVHKATDDFEQFSAWDSSHKTAPDSGFSSLCVIDTTRRSLVKTFAPRRIVDGAPVELNTHAVKAALRTILQLDTGVEQPEQAFLNSKSDMEASPRIVYYLFDVALSSDQVQAQMSLEQAWLSEHNLLGRLVVPADDQSTKLSVLKQVAGDSCPQCQNGTIKVQKAIEVGHTFHLGTRYSSKLDLVLKPQQKGAEATIIEMGCHGIGVSRLLAAVASSLSDETGLVWPAVIAPYHVVIIVDGNDEDRVTVATQLYDAISSSNSASFDVLLDDRKNVSAGYKLKDADLIGYSAIVIVGRSFTTGQVEIQCRARGQKELIRTEDAADHVGRTLRSLLN